MAFIDEHIVERPITKILSTSFLDYSMSVIASRALPDVRDGLKPVHRRIMYGMHALGVTHDKPHKKSARIVGDVMGKYHPHGDSSIYDTMVRLSQEWVVRERLVDMHGNNGSMDGDGAAAMRYTESRMSKLSSELLRDLDKNTVDFQLNYDEQETEPSVLPARFPNLLVNGSEGIAVAMATKIPPHNLREVCLATIAQMENEDITTLELMQYITGPDFPTGAQIIGYDGIRAAYETGKGSMVLRGKIEIEEKKGRTKLIIRELPYQVNPQKLVNQIRDIQDDWKEYIKDRASAKPKLKPQGLDFLVDDTLENLTGNKNKRWDVTIEMLLKKDVNPELVINYLYKHTLLQTSFSMNNLALVPRITSKGETKLEPRVLPLKDTLSEYIKHQIEVLTRRTQYEIDKAEERAHRLFGVIAALDQLDATIAVIRNAKDREDARTGLEKLLSIDEIQSNAILEMRLHRLTNLDQDKEREQYKELLEHIDFLHMKVNDPVQIKQEIKDDLQMIADKYGNDRRTEILPPVDEFNSEDLVPDDEVVVTVSHKEFIKRTLESNYRTQRRKGIGVNAMTIYEDDFIHHLHLAKNKDTLLFFTNKGRVYRKKVYQIPEATAVARGKNIRIFLNLEDNERIEAILSIREFSDEQYLVFATKKGIVKKSKLSDYANIRQNGIHAISLDTDDELIGVNLTNGERNITLVTKKGMSITFEETSVKSVGRTGRGVKGISLSAEDEIVSFVVHEEDADLFISTNEGYGKRTSLQEFRVQNRGGKGVICMKITDKNGEVIGCTVVQEEDTMMMMTKKGTLMKLLVKEISQFSRNTQGTRIIHLREEDELRLISRVHDEDEVESTIE